MHTLSIIAPIAFAFLAMIAVGGLIVGFAAAWVCLNELDGRR